mgnify:CR=1 FL=1
MDVRIRLKRVGAKDNPNYRVVVTDARSPRDGRFIEEIGSYHPLQKKDNFNLKLERVDYWLGVGAKPSPTVASFIKKARKEAVAEPQA